MKSIQVKLLLKITEEDKIGEAMGWPRLITVEEDELIQSLKVLGVENSDTLAKFIKAQAKAIGV